MLSHSATLRRPQRPPTTLLFAILLITILIFTSFLYWSLLVYGGALGMENGDLQFFRRWFSHIITSGFDALTGEYDKLSPPYVYLLYLSSFFHDKLSDVVLIKLPSICFNLFSAVFVYIIVRQLGRGARWALFAGCGFLLLPTVVLNSVYWGQFDVIYCSFILAFMSASLAQRPILAVACFGLAFSVKLQAVFLGPFLLYLVLKKEVLWRNLLLIPVVYMAAVMPAWFAGRPWMELILIYAMQGTAGHSLSMNAPNLYLFLENHVDYALTVFGGIIAAAAGGLAIALYGQRLKMEPREAKLLIATTSALLIPFLLPKMHDRYFFVADVFTFVLACSFPRFWWLAMLMQASSVSAYLSFLFGIASGPRIGAVFSTAAVIGLVRAYYQAHNLINGAYSRARTGACVNSRGAGAAGVGIFRTNR